MFPARLPGSRNTVLRSAAGLRALGLTAILCTTALHRPRRSLAREANVSEEPSVLGQGRSPGEVHHARRLLPRSRDVDAVEIARKHQLSPHRHAARRAVVLGRRAPDVRRRDGLSGQAEGPSRGIRLLLRPDGELLRESPSSTLRGLLRLPRGVGLLQVPRHLLQHLRVQLRKPWRSLEHVGRNETHLPGFRNQTSIEVFN